ncbi:cytochrome P450 [Protaetiibacter sp. SSC-01]|uniref:cytochrome P450 n=1 Tax=Protaetiibacter sp. SSC-01 TaxID=2759943 RepID=UPI001656B7C5|nr:cytochrome P450 [Protaetiibacter sp. SSC-01]QNO37231.1 cytochrome P450 [Protaetiibacter sp. SSC-01]
MEDTLRLLRDGYLWGTRGFDEAGADVFRTRLLGRRVLVLRGTDAARFFYEDGRFRRGPGAVPMSIAHLLQDEGSVQTLEGERHRVRKRLFLDLVWGEEARAGITDAVLVAWDALAAQREGGPVRLFDHAAEALTVGALAAVGVPGPYDAEAVTSELVSMVENAGRVGPPNWLARARRGVAAERRAREWIRDARARGDEASALGRIAHHREDGELLPEGIAGVELLNVLRPSTAAAHYLVFAAWALHRRPELRERMTASEEFRAAFAQEVRRFFPFFPFIGGRATRELSWRGHRIEEEDWVILDLYGTDHDPHTWDHPQLFDPNRFLGPGADRLVVAQGAGDPAADHRCPGELLTRDLIDRTGLLLAERPPHVLPEQDLRISLRRFPAMPRDGMRVTLV